MRADAGCDSSIVATYRIRPCWRWSLADAPAGFGGALTAVAAARNGTVWIGGEGRNLQTLYAIPSTFLRSGGGWQEVPFPNVPGCSTSTNGKMTRAELTDIASRGLRATWATGYCAAAGGERGFLVRFNGTRWIPVVTPDMLIRYGGRGQLNGVSMAPDGQVWAVGWSDDFGNDLRSVAFHGAGAGVAPVDAPIQGTGAALYAVAAERDGAAVAAGAFTQRGDSAPHAHLLGTDGLGALALEPADQTAIATSTASRSRPTARRGRSASPPRTTAGWCCGGRRERGGLGSPPLPGPITPTLRDEAR